MNWYKKYAASPQAWQMTQEQFMDHHRSGYIPEHAYEKYMTREGISWIRPKEEMPILHSKLNIDGKEIEFKQSGKKNRYVKTDDNGEIVRDASGLATYLSDEETLASGLSLYENGITAYDDQGPIGWVANSFGVPEVIVIREYHGKGIGTYLLSSWMKQRPEKQKIGQMTPSGERMSIAYHRQQLRDAISEGKEVPQEILKDYPELTQPIEKNNELV